MRLCSMGRDSTIVSALLLGAPAAGFSTGLSMVRFVDAAGGVWHCGAPHVEATRGPRSVPASPVRATIDAPRMAQAAALQRKMAMMANLRVMLFPPFRHKSEGRGWKAEVLSCRSSVVAFAAVDYFGAFCLLLSFTIGTTYGRERAEMRRR